MSIIVTLLVIGYLTQEFIDPITFIGIGLIFFFVDTWLFTKGYDTCFWGYRTKNELEAQRKKLGLNND